MKKNKWIISNQKIVSLLPYKIQSTFYEMTKCHGFYDAKRKRDKVGFYFLNLLKQC